MSYPEFVKQLKSLKLKKKGNKSKVSPNKFYPSQAELQTNEVLKGELDDYARKLMKGALDNGVKGVYDVLGAPPESFKKEVDRIAKEVSDFNVKVFADFSNMVVGERYFPSTDKKDLILRTWKENFVNLCKSTNEEMRKKSAGIISDGVLSGRNLKEMVKELQNTCSDFSRNKAELIATTEIGKLNTAISKAQNESAGIKYYEWAAAMDGRTRESHASMDGRICAWDNDDVYYEWVEGKEGKRELKEFKRTEKMYHGAPGTDFRCRCVAIPYIPEFEDDYEQERTEGPIQGVVQERPENVYTENNVNNTEGKGAYSEFVEDEKLAKMTDNKEIIRYMQDKHGINISSSFSTCNPKLFLEAMQGIDGMMTAFPDAKISDVKKTSGGKFIMAMCWRGNDPLYIEMNNMYLRNDNKLIPHRQSDFHPKNSSPKQSAAHEMGHVINYVLARKKDGKILPGGINAEIMAKEITKKAYEKTSGNTIGESGWFSEVMEYRKKISRYADSSYDYVETIAEAVGDVFVNRENAEKMSKEIYGILRKMYKNEFNS